MNKVIVLLFTFVYVVLAYFFAILGSVHGSSLFPYFELGFLVTAIAVLWWLCFYIPRRKVKHASGALTLSGIGLGALLIVASFASRGPLIDWDVRQMQKRAAATKVFNMRDEILLSQQGAPIGIRLNYSLLFPDSNYYWQSPLLFPQNDIGYTVGWNIVRETIEPAMQVVTAGADLVAIETAHLAPVVRRYEQGKVYNLTVDLVPDFLALSADRNRLCIVRPPTQFAAALEQLLTRENNSFYKVTVSGTTYSGLTQKAYSLQSFYNGAIREGASECKYRDGRISFK
jgi:hypothetical protein